MPALMAVIRGNSDPLKRELASVDRMVNRAGRNLENMGGHGGRSGPLRETLVLMREIGRGNWTRVPGSLSILLSQLGILKLLFKDTAAEARALATSQKVLAESTAAATTAVKAESEAAAIALTPLGWVALAVVAVGTAAFFTVRHFVRLREEQKKLAEISSLTATKLSDQADALRDAAKEAQGFSDWLQKLADDEGDLTDAIEEQLKSMRERASLQRELAQKNGASPKQIAQMEIEATQKEIEALNLAKSVAEQKRIQDQQDTIAAQAALNGNIAGSDAQRKSLSGRASFWKKVMDDLQEKVEKGEQVFVSGNLPGEIGMGTGTYRNATASDKLSVPGLPDMSLDEANAKYNQFLAEESKLDNIQKQLADALAEKKKLTEADNKAVQRLTREAKDLEAHLKNQKEFLPQIADAKGSGERNRMMHGHVNALQQIGAYAAPALQLDVARSQLKALHQIVANTSHHGNAGSPGSSAVKF